MTADVKPSDRIFCALDTTNTEAAVAAASNLLGVVGGIKLGLEFYCANGADGFKAVADTGMPIFLDLKFHDIPNTVVGALRAVMPLAPKILTIHTQGGPEMMRRAAETAAEEADRHGVAAPWVVGVTLLTSLDNDDLAAMSISGSTDTVVPTLAGLAQASGLDGIVCSPKEIAMVRSQTAQDFKLVVPGIRPLGSAAGDQKRVMAPREVISAGADILVIGRPITGADDPVAAAKAIAASL